MLKPVSTAAGQDQDSEFARSYICEFVIVLPTTDRWDFVSQRLKSRVLSRPETEDFLFEPGFVVIDCLSSISLDLVYCSIGIPRFIHQLCVELPGQPCAFEHQYIKFSINFRNSLSHAIKEGSKRSCRFSLSSH